MSTFFEKLGRKDDREERRKDKYIQMGGSGLGALGAFYGLHHMPESAKLKAEEAARKLTLGTRQLEQDIELAKSNLRVAQKDRQPPESVANRVRQIALNSMNNPEADKADVDRLFAGAEQLDALDQESAQRRARYIDEARKKLEAAEDAYPKQREGLVKARDAANDFLEKQTKKGRVIGGLSLAAIPASYLYAKHLAKRREQKKTASVFPRSTPTNSAINSFLMSELDASYEKPGDVLAEQGVKDVYTLVKRRRGRKGPKDRNIRVFIREGASNKFTNKPNKAKRRLNTHVIELAPDASVEDLLRELGRGTGKGGKLIRESAFYQRLLEGSRSAPMYIAGASGLIGAGGGLLSKDERSLDKADAALTIGAGLGGIAAVPGLVDETRATSRAIELAKKFRQPIDKAKVLRNYSKYLAKTVLPVAGAYGVGRAMIENRRDTLRDRKSRSSQ